LKVCRDSRAAHTQKDEVEELLSLFVDKAPHTNKTVAGFKWCTNKILETNPDASPAIQRPA